MGIRPKQRGRCTRSQNGDRVFYGGDAFMAPGKQKCSSSLLPLNVEWSKRWSNECGHMWTDWTRSDSVSSSQQHGFMPTLENGRSISIQRFAWYEYYYGMSHVHPSNNSCTSPSGLGLGFSFVVERLRAYRVSKSLCRESWIRGSVHLVNWFSKELVRIRLPARFSSREPQ
ncbi:hypothetical protein MPTK1_8g04590 [Marchantia polymorpha subsp. ruderalis]|uniref:Uncharacterized protein n=1 Tax=Marchantia polymorpha TaxID=3197 RepID=A0A2R6W1I4_MARPO|nr:hypothetical protein MARPO_0186s0010 [Marchantia polymorpha]BBN18688.1 hypothetical protein Mp_8g04590 [Marchantia polymorpha subsp. ruderalis]|eukprot:PTQ27711.1 hypothetical protein MARPO_0186s0010 [Marchantia polymorpha]